MLSLVYFSTNSSITCNSIFEALSISDNIWKKLDFYLKVHKYRSHCSMYYSPRIRIQIKRFIKIKELKMIFFFHYFTFIVPQFFLGLPVLPLLAPYPWVNDAGPAARKSNLWSRYFSQDEIACLLPNTLSICTWFLKNQVWNFSQ